MLLYPSRSLSSLLLLFWFCLGWFFCVFVGVFFKKLLIPLSFWRIFFTIILAHLLDSSLKFQEVVTQISLNILFCLATIFLLK